MEQTSPDTSASAPVVAGDKRMPVFYLSHGGGPWSFMQGDFRQMFNRLEASLRDVPRQLPMPPKAILVISSHWEEAQFSVTTAAQPGMVYDYAGFPLPMYRVQYPAPGSPALAEQVAGLLEQAGWSVGRNATRGYDHATFSLLKAVYPDANVPVVQLSIRAPLLAAEHFRMGQMLTPLREQGVLILGSGQSFHNLRVRGPEARRASEAFDIWLRHSVLSDPDMRRALLMDWEFAPSARIAHPRPDHFVPLHVVAGAAGEDSASCIFGDYIMDLATSAYRFGGDEQDSPFDVLRLHEHMRLQSSALTRADLSNPNNPKPS